MLMMKAYLVHNGDDDSREQNHRPVERKATS